MIYISGHLGGQTHHIAHQLAAICKSFHKDSISKIQIARVSVLHIASKIGTVALSWLKALHLRSLLALRYLKTQIIQNQLGPRKRDGSQQTLLTGLPPEIQSLIFRHLDGVADRCNVAMVHPSLHTGIAFADQQTCRDLTRLINTCLAQEPKLKEIFPHFDKCLSSHGDLVKLDIYKLSQIALNLRQMLRTIALHWGYYHPDLLRQIVEKLGYLRFDQMGCDQQFDKLDTKWLYGPLIPQLLDRAITSSCISSLKMLLSFIPLSKRLGQDGNLSSSLAVGTPRAKKGRADLNMAIMCLLRRDLYSRAENRRFAAYYGAKAAGSLAQISPAFDPLQTTALQCEEKDGEIWQLMRCSDKRAEITKAAQELYAMMKRDFKISFIPPILCVPTSDQIDEKQLAHIPPVLWDRHLEHHASPERKSIRGGVEHKSQLMSIRRLFCQAQPPPKSVAMQLCNSLVKGFATFVEMTLYKSIDEQSRRVFHYRNCPSLFEALHLSLFGYTHHAVALREAVKSFLFKTGQSAEFPHGKLEALFNPLQENRQPNQLNSKGNLGRFSPDFLTYEWLLTAVVAKLFGRQIYICSEVSCGKKHLPTGDEIDHFINFSIDELRKYNLWDLEIEHQYWAPKSDGRLYISASFCLQSKTTAPTHSLIAKHSECAVESYFVPVYDEAPKGRFSPPQSP